MSVAGFSSTLPKSHEHPKRALGRDRLLRCFAGFGPHAAGSPGEILRDDFIEPRGLSANALARALHVPPDRISAILYGTRSITADTALRLARYFNTTPQPWLNLQKNYELEVAKVAATKTIAAEVAIRAAGISCLRIVTAYYQSVQAESVIPGATI